MLAFYTDGGAFSAFDLIPPIEFHGEDLRGQNRGTRVQIEDQGATTD